MKGRAAQRGKPLEWFCKSASVSRNEFGENDPRCFCYGLMDAMTDDYFEECIKCGAFVDNATPQIEKM